MKKRHMTIALASTAFVAALVVASLVRIAPDEVGVRTNNFGFGNKGIVQQDFGPGWHFHLPLVYSWTLYPAKVRKVELTKDPRQRSLLGEDALLVQSSDGDRVMLDLDIFYRIKPGEAHKLLLDSGPGDGHVRVLRSLAKERLRAIFGTLRTEAFYDPRARHAKTMEALASLDEALRPRSLWVVDLMIQDVEFEPKYEQKIKDKKLADQQGELQKAQARAAAERAIVAGIQVATNATIKLLETKTETEAAQIKAEAEKYATMVKAEADLYSAEKRAQGSLAAATAEAKIKRAKTQALAGSGGNNLVALEAVNQLKIDSIAFPTSGSDWFDVRQMATRLGAKP